MKRYLPLIKRFFNRKQKIFLLIVFLFLLFTFSCIEKFTPDLNQGELQSLLVVEGQITDEEGPFRVKLSSTFEIDNMQLYSPPVYGAEVQIFDDKGNQFQLFYDTEGWYETENKHLKGVPGNTYILAITTEDGIQYESSPVLMKNVPDIDNVYFEEVQRTHFEDGGISNEEWVDILLDTKGTSGDMEYYRWEFEETWEVKLLEDSVLVQHGWDAESAYFTVEEVELGENVEEVCWVTIPSKSILIASTVNNAVNEINKFLLTSIGTENDKLHIKYSILVKQYSLNQELYKFWRGMEGLYEQSGGIYGRIPAQVYGNIHCCNGKQKALGYFSTSAVKTKRIFIYPYNNKIKTTSAYKGCQYITPRDPTHSIPTIFFGFIDNGNTKIYSISDFCSDCREYGTSVKPDFWE